MPLVKETIKTEIKTAFEQVMNQSDDDRAGAIDKVADKIASTIVEAIKSVQITYAGGLVAPAMGGPLTGIFKYTIL